jgi:putative acetyltransferase
MIERIECGIRGEVRGDVPHVYEVEAAAFGQTLQAEIVDALRATAEPHLSLVATLGEHVVGHIFFSPATLASEPAVQAAQLSPLAVDPAHQRKGIGSALVREGLTRCRAMGWSLVFLLGDPRYYSRFGFMLAAPQGFTYGNPVADAALQVFEVSTGAVRKISGRVRFHEAFEVAESNQ